MQEENLLSGGKCQNLLVLSSVFPWLIIVRILFFPPVDLFLNCRKHLNNMENTRPVTVLFQVAVYENTFFPCLNLDKKDLPRSLTGFLLQSRIMFYIMFSKLLFP